jgi:hypothetical protein
MKMMMERGIKTVEPTEKAIEDWRNDILATDKLTLFPTANSWYNGGNVAGKKKEQFVFVLYVLRSLILAAGCSS